jgi:hypothetical protein
LSDVDDTFVLGGLGCHRLVSGLVGLGLEMSVRLANNFLK